MDQLRGQLIGRRPVVAALALAAGCGGAGELADTHRGPEAVVEALLSRLHAEDRDGMAALAVSEDEFRAVVYPTLPASQPERNTSADFVWSQHALRHFGGLEQTFVRYRGADWELVKLAFDGETTDHGAYRLHRDARVTVRYPDGAKRTVRLFGSMIEQQRRFKIYSFIVD